MVKNKWTFEDKGREYVVEARKIIISFKEGCKDIKAKGSWDPERTIDKS